MEDLLEMPQMEVVRLNVTDSEIARMKEDFMSLTINGIEDKAGYKKVFESRQIVKKTRTGLVKYADELKEKALVWQRKVNSEKNRVVGELEAIEAHLQSEEDKIEKEKEAIRVAAERAESARVQTRIDKLAAYGFGVDYETVKIIDDASFETVLANAKSEYEKNLAAKAEADRLAKEEDARLKAEREELQKLREQQAHAQKIIDENNARIKKEHEAKEKVIREEQEKIEAEKRKIEDDKLKAFAEKKRAEELEKARKEAAEAARKKAIADAAKAQAEKEAADKAAKLEAERQASLRPDKEKLQSFADTLFAMKMPDVVNDTAKEIVSDISLMMAKMQAHIVKKIKLL
jgi:hypothetical protein